MGAGAGGVNVALLVITDRPAYLRRTLESFSTQVGFDFSDYIVIDDQDHKLGGAGAIRAGWEQVRATDAEFVFHLEDDWTFPLEVDVAEMVNILAANPDLANVVLRRQPSPHDPPAGYIDDTYLPRDGFMEHRNGFWLNPCVYRRSIVENFDWPIGGHEHHFSALLLRHGYSFAMLGAREDPPRCWHIGDERAPGSHW